MKKMESFEKIDFVITWVDGNDPKWIKEKNKYLNIKGDSGINRFRSGDNLQYIFRGIEKFAPWVNKVFFITWGHIPDWLDTNNEKLVIVKHEDFIPKEFLPTFNSNVIEMNLFRIKNLSSKFVLFNDDLFILKRLKPQDFFEKNLPKDMYIEYVKENCSRRHSVLRENYNNIINKYFIKKDFIKSNLSKVLNIKYGIGNFNTLKLLKTSNFNDIYTPHLTQSFLKETFEEIWEKEEVLLTNACKNRFRADTDIGCTICRYWQLFNGNFIPSKILGKYYIMSNDNRKIISAIKNKRYKLICINDASTDVDFEKAKNEINCTFEEVFREKSSFEL